MNTFGKNILRHFSSSVRMCGGLLQLLSRVHSSNRRGIGVRRLGGFHSGSARSRAVCLGSEAKHVLEHVDPEE